MNKDGVRVQAGDPSLHAVINENGKRVDRAASEGDVLATALVGVREDDSDKNAKPIEDFGPAWAKDFNQTRQNQLYDNLNNPQFQDHLNQCALGIAKPTKQIKLEAAIPLTAPLADYMDISQTVMRQYAQVLARRDAHLPPQEFKQKCAKVRKTLIAVQKDNDCDGVRKRPFKESFARKGLREQAKHEKKTQRVLMIELKEKAAAQNALDAANGRDLAM